MSIDHFYYSPRILRYDFGPQHPLKPERLRRTIELLARYGVSPVDPGPSSVEDILRVHDLDYVEAVRTLSDGDRSFDPSQFGFGRGDNPIFAGMWEASLAYCGATAAAAKAVAGGASLAFGIGGGLHHAHRNRASGFCIFDDPAIACHILLDKFERLAYVDIDVHHGDGVQWMFYDEPRVLTCSIHEEGRTLFPGTGGIHEVGTQYSSFNVPLQAKTSGDVWLDAFLRTIPEAVATFGAEAVVLQLGTDTHTLDPLGHIKSSQQEWLEAVNEVKSWNLPIVAVGGGGYNLNTVPRMWTSACLTLAGIEFEDRIPSDLGSQWNVETFSDALQGERGIGRDHAAAVVHELLEENIPRLAG